MPVGWRLSIAGGGHAGNGSSGMCINSGSVQHEAVQCSCHARGGQRWRFSCSIVNDFVAAFVSHWKPMQGGVCFRTSPMAARRRFFMRVQCLGAGLSLDRNCILVCHWLRPASVKSFLLGHITKRAGLCKRASDCTDCPHHY